MTSAASVSSASSTPWVEKYRPTNFDDIVLDEINRTILENIINKGYFPNLLFYGPPGTGKTTTIINLVKEFQSKYKSSDCASCEMGDSNGINANDGLGTVIHLNASDERGVDVIRSQISAFVNTKSLFGGGSKLKFIILDEVDYMTKNAQIALRYLINNYNKNVSCNVKFCLICNYVSKIDDSLQSEFVRMRFNQLPEDRIVQFLMHISASENLNLTVETAIHIQKQFGSDLRGMINFMQSNQSVSECKIIHQHVWTNLLKTPNAADVANKFNTISLTYGIEKRNMLRQFLNTIIRSHTTSITGDLLNRIEHIMHNQECNTEYVMQYISLIITKWAREMQLNNDSPPILV
jgi:DNA polymerase III delta prime subunit